MASHPRDGRVGRYEIVRILGRGGMATVYLAHQTDLDRDVALKELSLFDRSEPQLARRFLREARLAGSLSHPNIVTVHDYLEHAGTPYIAMEYMERGPLRPYVGRLSLAQIGGVLKDVLGGLAYAEERGVVHRDMKPENIMVSAQGSVKIADFGIAKATSATPTSADLTTTGTTLGTPRYMAPERAMGQEIGPWSDLYSVGVMMFELLVGRTPFHDTDVPMVILMRQINEPIPPVRSLVPDVDPAISAWVEQLLVKDPAGRTQSAVTAWDELDEILNDLLGPRWSRDAGLPALSGGAAATVAQTARPVPRVRAMATATAPTAPMGDGPAPTTPAAPIGGDHAPIGGLAPMGDGLAPTLPPGRGAAPTVRRRKRRFPAVKRVAMLAAVLVAGVAAATVGGGGQEPNPAGTGMRDSALVGLQDRARAHGGELASAPTLAAKGEAAQRLAGDYAGAARTLAALDRVANRRVVAALDRTARAYSDAAAAARRGDAAAYAAGQARADARRRATDRALDTGAQPDQSGVGDSRSDDPSDDEPDEEDEDENGD